MYQRIGKLLLELRYKKIKTIHVCNIRTVLFITRKKHVDLNSNLSSYLAIRNIGIACTLNRELLICMLCTQATCRLIFSITCIFCELRETRIIEEDTCIKYTSEVRMKITA